MYLPLFAPGAVLVPTAYLPSSSELASLGLVSNIAPSTLLVSAVVLPADFGFKKTKYAGLPIYVSEIGEPETSEPEPVRFDIPSSMVHLKPSFAASTARSCVADGVAAGHGPAAQFGGYKKVNFSFCNVYDFQPA